MYWSFGCGSGVGAWGGATAHFLAPVWARLAGGQLGFVFGQLGGVTGLGAGFDLGPRFGQLRLAFPAAHDFVGNGQAVVPRRGVGGFGFGHQLLHFPFELFDPLPGPLVAHGAVFARVGQRFGAVGDDGDLAELGHFQLVGQLQDFHKALGEERLVLPAEGADRVVVGIWVSAVSTRTGTLSWVAASMRRRLKGPVA